MRALVVSNMLPDAAHPERGGFVRDQVQALRGLADVEVELAEFAPGARALAGAALALRARYGRTTRGPGSPFDVVHAHFGLTAWPALAVPARVRALTVHGTDVRHPRTRLLTAAALPRMDIVAAVSAQLAAELPLRSARSRALVLPCGVDTTRFRALPREHARAELGLREQRYLLFPADPARAGKRHDRALALAAAAGVPLLTLGGVEPERVPLWVNAADVVVVPSDSEGFGLAVLEALACDVPVLATPVGVHAEALADLAGALCAPFELPRWLQALRAQLRADDPRIAGRARAERYSAARMAGHVRDAWAGALAVSGQRGG